MVLSEGGSADTSTFLVDLVGAVPIYHHDPLCTGARDIYRTG